MLSRFIVATDLSPASYGLVKCISGLKAYGAKECLLLQCLSFQEAASMAIASDQAILKAELMEQKKILENHGFSVEPRTVVGFAKNEINRIAVEEDYSLIVVGSRGHSLLEETFLGSVTLGVLQKAQKPVLIVRLAPGEGKECIRAANCDFSGHILFATDFSENADNAFGYLENQISKEVKKITLLHIQDKTRIDPHLLHRLDEFNTIDRGRLERFQDILKKKTNAQIVIELGYGSPFQEISQYIRQHDVNLVVMGSQGRGWIKELFIGSLSHKIAYNSDVAVLLIPASR